MQNVASIYRDIRELTALHELHSDGLNSEPFMCDGTEHQGIAVTGQFSLVAPRLVITIFIAFLNFATE